MLLLLLSQFRNSHPSHLNRTRLLIHILAHVISRLLASSAWPKLGYPSGVLH